MGGLLDSGLVGLSRDDRAFVYSYRRILGTLYLVEDPRHRVPGWHRCAAECAVPILLHTNVLPAIAPVVQARRRTYIRPVTGERS